MKTRWFIKTENKSLTKRFGIPYATVRDWEKKQTDGEDYRGYLYDHLSLILKIEGNTIAKIEKMFTKDELMALWGAFAKSTLLSFDMIEFDKALEYGFREYCEYEEMEAAQFLVDGEEIDAFAKRIGAMLSSLSEFEKVVLFEYLKEYQSTI